VLLLNSDAWLCRKKGKNFLSAATRRIICEQLRDVVAVLEFDDSDGSAAAGIRLARTRYPDMRLIFANGGDRTKDNIPELAVCRECNVDVEFAVGGERKENSSSWILHDWESRAEAA
jgi:D-beta-D-heptose 7-phosphate kinase/D-beta-D-heptose 1-phosphate adenosyltransferase